MRQLVDILKVVGESTRLRILVLLRHCELTTTELCQILGQTQPRVSRHLKLLNEAELILRHAEGAKAYYRLADTGVASQVLTSVLELLDGQESELQADQQRLADVRSDRAKTAASYFSSVATDWDHIRSLHIPDGPVEAALLSSVGSQSVGTLLDIGTGTGRMIELLADRFGTAIGIDNNAEMLNVARTNLDRAGFEHCSVRKGDAYSVEQPNDSVDVVIIHQLLHFLDEPVRAIGEAARILRDGGRLLVVDFATHDIERLRYEYNHCRLGFSDEQFVQWCSETGLADLESTRFKADRTSEENLTVTLWQAVLGKRPVEDTGFEAGAFRGANSVGLEERAS